MEIICPHCDFSRIVPDDKIPATAEMATCPKCGQKFRFRTLEESAPQVRDAAPRTAPAPERSVAPPAPPLPYENEPADQRTPSSESRPASPAPEGDVFSGLDALGERDEQRDPQRRSWARSYEDDAYDGNREEEVPWERLDVYGFFPGLFQTIKRAMLHPQQFFASMPLGRGFMRPMVFYVLLSMVYAIMQYAFESLGLSMLGRMTDQGEMMGAGEFVGMGAASALILLLYPIVFTVGLFLMAAIYHLFLSLFQAASSGFEGTFRAVAYGSAPSILTVVPILGWMVASVWTLVVTIIGLKTIHRTTYARVLIALCAQIITFILLIGFIIYLIHGMIN